MKATAVITSSRYFVKDVSLMTWILFITCFMDARSDKLGQKHQTQTGNFTQSAL